MLVPLQRLILRTQYARSRADELLDVHRRLHAAGAESVTEGERTAASEVGTLKIRVADALADVQSCARCARGKPAPRGVFAGGDCCTGVTAELFTDDELAAIAGGGATPRDLRAPRTAHAGCAFRGATGCSLAAQARPERCVSYTCGTLRRELHARGDLAHVEALIAELHATMERFLALRCARLDDTVFG